MRIAWDLQAVTGSRPTGLGVSVAFMLKAFIDHAAQFEMVGLRPNSSNQALKSVGDRLAWEQWRLPKALRRANRKSRLDLCFSPALGAPLTSPIPVVAHVHDLIPLLYPQSFQSIAGWYWKKMLPCTWKRCVSLTVSNQTVADDIVNLLGYDAQKIHIVPYYPDPGIVTTANQIQPRFAEINIDDAPVNPRFVTISSLEPRKNIELAIKAISKLKSQGTTAKLICIGGITAHKDELTRLATELGVAKQIEFAGYLEREQVVTRLLNCTALLFVSRYEGYGMPPLEAMSVGTAVVLSNIGCHRSVYDDQQRWVDSGATDECRPKFVSVDDADALAHEMDRLISDRMYRANLRRSGLAYSSTFSPKDTADGLCRAFQAVAGAT